MKDWEIISVIKDTIYLNFSQTRNNCIHKDIIEKLKWKKRNAIQFNLCGKAILLFKNNSKSDTLSYKQAKSYKISTIEDLNKKIKNFRIKTYKKRPKNDDDKLFQAYDNNDIFKTYIIEFINDDKFVIYPVIWKNQRIEQ